MLFNKNTEGICQEKTNLYITITGGQYDRAGANILGEEFSTIWVRRYILFTPPIFTWEAFYIPPATCLPGFGNRSARLLPSPFPAYVMLLSPAGPIFFF